VRTEFSPSPQETLRLVGLHYRQPRKPAAALRQRVPLTRAAGLIGVLQQRPDDASRPWSTSRRPNLNPAQRRPLRQNLLGAWAE